MSLVFNPPASLRQTQHPRKLLLKLSVLWLSCVCSLDAEPATCIIVAPFQSTLLDIALVQPLLSNALTTGTPTSRSCDGRHHLTIAILMLLRLTRSTSLISMQILQIGFFDAKHAQCCTIRWVCSYSSHILCKRNAIIVSQRSCSNA